MFRVVGSRSAGMRPLWTRGSGFRIGFSAFRLSKGAFAKMCAIAYGIYNGLNISSSSVVIIIRDLFPSP